MTNGTPWPPPIRATIGLTPPARTPGGAGPWSDLIDTTSQPTDVLEPASDDPAIVRAVLDGDRDAFRHLVEREAAGVIRSCHRVLGDLGEAEDVAQDAFVIAYRSLGSWRGDGPFGAWLSRIAVRLAIRQSARRRTIAWAQPGTDRDGAPVDPMARLSAGPGADPESHALRGERHQAVRKAVAALDEPYREVVALRFFAERSLDEIAAVTGRPLGTVKTHLYRGLIRLRAELGETAR